MSYEDIILGNKKIGKQYPVYIIAEVGSNHNQNLEMALNMIEKSLSQKGSLLIIYKSDNF